MSDSICLAGVLRDLFPPGLIDPEDEKAYAIFQACTREFELILQKAQAVICGSSDEIFKIKWPRLLGMPGLTLDPSPGRVDIKGVTNTAKRLRAGQTIQAPLTLTLRNEEPMREIQALMQASALIQYEVIYT